MESLYKNLTKKKFKIIAILLAFFSDLAIAKYIWDIFSNKAVFEKSFLVVMDNMEKNPDFNRSTIPKDFFNELFAIWTQALLVLLLAVIFVHLINYLLYYKEKVFAYKYLRAQAWMGGISFLLAGIAATPKVITLSLAGLGLLYVAFGLREFTVKSPEPKS